MTWFASVFNQPAIRNPVAIGLGAIAGALTRYYLSLWFVQRFGAGFPYGTLFINITGCLVMGFFATLALETFPNIASEIKLFIAVGFLGSYTTFSTYGLETFLLLRNGNLFSASFYWVGSAILGIIGIKLGVALASLWK